jgi:hypothetical protein
MIYQLFCSGFAAASTEVGVYESLTDLMTAANDDFVAKRNDLQMPLRLEWNENGAKVFHDPEEANAELMWGYPIVRVG